MNRVPFVTRRTGLFLTVMLIAVGLRPSLCVAFPAPEMLGLGDFATGLFYSEAKGVSADGLTVVGFGTVAPPQSGGNPYWPHAFRWQNGIMTDITPGNGPCSTATAVSSDGSAVAGESVLSLLCGGVDHHGVLWSWSGAGGSTPEESSFNAISGDGTVTAGYRVPVSPSPIATATKFTLTAPNTFQVQSLGLISGSSGGSNAFGMSLDGSSIVGHSTYSGGGSKRQAFRWRQNEGMIGLDPLHQFTSSQANAISSNSEVVVGELVSGLGTEAFLWTQDNGMVPLGDLPGGTVSARAYAIDGYGWSIVGTGKTASSNSAFIWDPVNGMRDLRDVLTGLGVDMSNWKLVSARGISYDGTVIVGAATDALGNNYQAYRAVLPEPAALYLLVLGALLARRRRQSAKK